MKKLLMILLLVVACTCGGVQRKSEPPPDPVIDDAHAMLIKVKCGKDRWVGTGYTVDSETVITAGHVLACDTKPDVYLVFPNSMPVDVTELDHVVAEDFDIGLIHYKSNAPDLELALVEPGEQVCFFPANPVRGQQCGLVIESEIGGGGILMTNTVKHGNSGSALFNSKGQIVGVVVAIDFTGFGRATGFKGLL